MVKGNPFNTRFETFLVLLCRWNARHFEGKDNEVIHLIWNLFQPEAMTVWNQDHWKVYPK